MYVVTNFGLNPEDGGSTGAGAGAGAGACVVVDVVDIVVACVASEPNTADDDAEVVGCGIGGGGGGRVINGGGGGGGNRDGAARIDTPLVPRGAGGGIEDVAKDVCVG